MINGFTAISLMLLDVLSDFDTLKICIGYEIDGKMTTDFPAYQGDLEKAKPVITVLPGWKSQKEEIRGIRNFEELPVNCQNYVNFIEEQIGYPITMVSNGPGRDDIIYRKSLLKK